MYIQVGSIQMICITAVICITEQLGTCALVQKCDDINKIYTNKVPVRWYESVMMSIKFMQIRYLCAGTEV